MLRTSCFSGDEATTSWTQSALADQGRHHEHRGSRGHQRPIRSPSAALCPDLTEDGPAHVGRHLRLLHARHRADAHLDRPIHRPAVLAFGLQVKLVIRLPRPEDGPVPGRSVL